MRGTVFRSHGLEIMALSVMASLVPLSSPRLAAQGCVAARGAGLNSATLGLHAAFQCATYAITPEEDNGVPVHDWIGGSDWFRRPGYAVSIEPGVAAMLGTWSMGLYTPVAVHRNREKSVPDPQLEDATGIPRHGDAAFADFLVMFTLAKGF